MKRKIFFSILLLLNESTSFISMDIFFNSREFTLKRIHNAFFQCIWNIPFFPFYEWIFSSFLSFQNFNLKRVHILSMHLKHTTFEYFFLFSEQDDVLISNESTSFRCIWNIRHSYLKNIAMDISFDSREDPHRCNWNMQTSGYLSLPNSHTFHIRRIFETSLLSQNPLHLSSVRAVHIFLLASSTIKRIFKIHLSLESGRQQVKLSVVAYPESIVSFVIFSLSTMEPVPYFARVSIKRAKWK